MQSLELKANRRNVKRGIVIKWFCTGEGWGMLKECVDILKWQWENNEQLLIGGWEPHTDVTSHCFWSRHGGRRCHSDLISHTVEPHKTWREPRLVNPGLFARIKTQGKARCLVGFECFSFILEANVTLKVTLRNIPLPQTLTCTGIHHERSSEPF